MSQHRMPRAAIAAAAVGTLLQAGAQLFAVTVIVRRVTAAPPRSLAMYAGEYGYDSGPFWEVMPTVTLVLLLIAAVTNWRTTERPLVLGAVGTFLLAGIFAAFVTGPLQAEVTSTALSDSVDPALALRAARWYALDGISFLLTLIPGLLLIRAHARSSEKRPGQDQSSTA